MKKTAALEHIEALSQMPAKMQKIFHKHFRNNGIDFLQLLKFAKDNDYTYDDIVAAADIVPRRVTKSSLISHPNVNVRGFGELTVKQAPLLPIDYGPGGFGEKRGECQQVCGQFVRSQSCSEGWH